MAAEPDFLPREASTDLLISQWANAFKLRTLLDIWFEALDVQIREPRERLRLMQNLNTAEGVWLDRIGERVNLERPSLPSTITSDYFGFDSAGVSFDQQPFTPDSALAGRVPMGDGAYRNALRARAVMLTGRGSLADYRRAIQFIEPAATVTEGTLKFTITTANQNLIQLLIDAGAVIKIPGVQINYATP